MKEKKSSRTSRFFNRIASEGWHKSDFFTYTWKYPALRRWLAAQLLPREKLILSIGCGSGEIERDLSKMDLRVVGLDMSHEMLRAAARRHLKNLVQADAQLLPFADGCFDLVIFMESVGYFDLVGVLREVRRVLKTGGRVLMTAYPLLHDSDAFCKRVTLREVSRDLRSSGFNVVKQLMLTVDRRGVTPVRSENESALLYTLARKKPGMLGPKRD